VIAEAQAAAEPALQAPQPPSAIETLMLLLKESELKAPPSEVKAGAVAPPTETKAELVEPTKPFLFGFFLRREKPFIQGLYTIHQETERQKAEIQAQVKQQLEELESQMHAAVRDNCFKMIKSPVYHKALDSFFGFLSPEDIGFIVENMPESDAKAEEKAVASAEEKAVASAEEIARKAKARAKKQALKHALCDYLSLFKQKRYEEIYERYGKLFVYRKLGKSAGKEINPEDIDLEDIHAAIKGGIEWIRDAHHYFHRVDNNGVQQNVVAVPHGLEALGPSLPHLSTRDTFLSRFSRKIFYIKGIVDALPDLNELNRVYGAQDEENLRYVEEEMLRPFAATVNRTKAGAALGELSCTFFADKSPKARASRGKFLSLAADCSGLQPLTVETLSRPGASRSTFGQLT